MYNVHEYLLDAASRNDCHSILFYIGRGANVNTQDVNGRTPLHIAAENNCLHAADILIKYGANPEAKMEDGGTPLRDAVVMDHHDMAAFLISAGARTDAIDDCEWTVLHWAASEDNVKTALLLMRYNRSLVNMARWNGVTALHLVQSPAMTRLLLSTTTIEALYDHANLYPDDFEYKTGMDKPGFDALLNCFSFNTPQRLAKEVRLFAILFAARFGLNGEEIGRLLSYTNMKRDGTRFIDAGNAALTLAIQNLNTVSSGHDVLPVDREYIKRKTDAIFEQVPIGPWTKDIRYAFGLSRMYYNIDRINPDELNSLKWKTYIYLRKCVLDYREGRINELNGIIRFLESSSDNRAWFANRLLDKPVQCEGELWGSGSHEWIERSLIVDVLKRSAGMVEGIEAEAGIGCIAPDYDWLYYQAIIRSPTKYVLFKNSDNTIENGHPGAVKPNQYERGFAITGSPGFHKLCVDAFYSSTTIEGFLKRIRNIFKQELYSGKKVIHETSHPKYLVDGSKTSNLIDLGLFRKRKLVPEYIQFRDSLSDNIEYATHFGDNEREDISDVASDTTEIETDDESLNEYLRGLTLSCRDSDA